MANKKELSKTDIEKAASAFGLTPSAMAPIDSDRGRFGKAPEKVTKDDFEETMKRVERKLDAIFKYLEAVDKQVADHEGGLMKLMNEPFGELDYWSNPDRARDGAMYELREVFENGRRRGR